MALSLPAINVKQKSEKIWTEKFCLDTSNVNQLQWTLLIRTDILTALKRAPYIHTYYLHTYILHTYILTDFVLRNINTPFLRRWNFSCVRLMLNFVRWTSFCFLLIRVFWKKIQLRFLFICFVFCQIANNSWQLVETTYVGLVEHWWR